MWRLAVLVVLSGCQQLDDDDEQALGAGGGGESCWDYATGRPGPCSDADPPGGQAYNGPVNVYVLGVLAGPQAPDGGDWDGNLYIETKAVEMVLQRLGVSGAVQEYIGVEAAVEQLHDEFAPPDLTGSADLGGESRDLEPTQINSFHTGFFGPPSWSGVALGDDVVLQLDVDDRDLWFDDIAGTVYVSAHEMRAALSAGDVYPVAVYDQLPTRSLLYVQILVEPASLPLRTDGSEYCDPEEYCCEEDDEDCY